MGTGMLRACHLQTRCVPSQANLCPVLCLFRRLTVPLLTHPVLCPPQALEESFQRLCLFQQGAQLFAPAPALQPEVPDQASSSKGGGKGGKAKAAAAAEAADTGEGADETYSLLGKHVARTTGGGRPGGRGEGCRGCRGEHA